MDLRGRTALVTGGARRIGAACCRRLAAAGCNVVIHFGTSAEAAEALAAGLREAGVQAATVAGDLSDAETLAALWESADAAVAPVSILVNNAAVYPRTPLADVTLDDWRLALRVNLVAPVELARRGGLAMRDRGGGVIVNLIDWAIASPQPNFLPYHASKGGLEVATRALARELAPAVRVNAVSPGPILPPENAPAGHVEKVLAQTPLGRLGDPNDIAAAVQFLAEADYITGAVLPVDGGRSVG